MLSLTELKINRRIIIGAVVALFVIVAIAVWAVWMYSSGQAAVQPPVQNIGQQPAVDSAKLGQDYQQKSKKILSDFFAAAAGGDVAAAAAQAQQDMLALSLPAEYRQKHLSAVLLLGEIKSEAASGQTAAVTEKMAGLKQLAD